MTPKQNKFSQLVASGKPLSDAYRSAYKVENMKANTIHKEASQLMGKEDVRNKVSELIEIADREAINQRVATREQVLETLTNFMRDGQPADTPKIRAAELLGKHYSLFSEHFKIEPPPRTSNEIAQEIKQLLQNDGP